MSESPSLDDILGELNAEVIELQWLDEMFDTLNSAHFKGALPRPTFASANHEGKFAVYVPKPYVAIVFHPRTLEQARRWIADSLLHEMVHMGLDDGNLNTGQEHGRDFVARANKIGQMLGLRPVSPGTDQAINWPQSVRKKGYAEWI
jgi:hypothetical protein